MASYDELAAATDDLADDDLAERVAALPEELRVVVLALWRRVRGETAPAAPEPVPEPAAPELG